MGDTIDKLLMLAWGIEGDLNLLQKARRSAKLLTDNPTNQTIKAIAKLIQYTNQEFTKHVDLPQLLKNSAKKGVTISDKRANDYALVPLNTTGDGDYGFEQTWGNFKKPFNNNQSKRFAVYLDAPIALGLFYKNEPNAIVGFVASDPQTLMIHQMQGVRPEIRDAQFKIIKKGSSRGLMPLDWEYLLVTCVEQLAKEMNFQETAIRSGHHNKWKDQQKFPLEKMLERYDQVAERLGYLLGNDQNWYKDVSDTVLI